MANPKHLAILKQSVAAWNDWRSEHPTIIGPELSEGDLSEASLSGVNLSRTDLGRADLSGADLSEADLSEANLSGANLSNADLLGANLLNANLTRAKVDDAILFGANLSNADFSRADLNNADLRRAHLNGTNLSGTKFAGNLVGWTTFADCDLSVAVGLDSLLHVGPSSIGIETIYKSGGKVPQAFLRGAGVPGNFIEYMSSLTGTGIEFYSCFISYSTKDQEFAERLHADLQSKGVRCWFAPHNMEGGRKIHEQIDDAIRVHDKVLLILSPASIESAWVKREILKARAGEMREDKQVLFPVRLVDFETLQQWEYLDADTGQDLAREIRGYFIPDFSNWKNHDAYKKGFDKLLKDLKDKSKKPPLA